MKNKLRFLVVSILACAWIASAYVPAGAQNKEQLIISPVPETVTSITYKGEDAYPLPSANDVNNLEKWKRVNPDIISEIIEERTPTSKHFLMNDGTYTAVFSLEYQHYTDSSGHLYDIDTQLVDESDLAFVNAPISKDSVTSLNNKKMELEQKRLTQGKLDQPGTRLRAPFVPFDLSIPKDFTDGYWIQRGNSLLSFTPIGANSVYGTMFDKSQMNYLNVWTDTDVQLKVTETGIKETIILNSIAAPTSFRYELVGEISNDLKNDEFYLEPAWLMDGGETGCSTSDFEGKWESVSGYSCRYTRPGISDNN
ncbi:hypothetical protein [Paenibacillus koleovorans]|uniref:hypothetical protein n=1 Tax=Paenibacillus koleovorans TaxID=121608 RepID=UPI000FD79481|nr:hypothetical protein [Paenibacillus koleovorans]